MAKSVTGGAEDCQIAPKSHRTAPLRYRTPEEFAASDVARQAYPLTPVVSVDPAQAGSEVQVIRSVNLTPDLEEGEGW